MEQSPLACKKRRARRAETAKNERRAVLFVAPVRECVRQSVLCERCDAPARTLFVKNNMRAPALLQFHACLFHSATLNQTEMTAQIQRALVPVLEH